MQAAFQSSDGEFHNYVRSFQNSSPERIFREPNVLFLEEDRISNAIELLALDSCIDLIFATKRARVFQHQFLRTLAKLKALRNHLQCTNSTFFESVFQGIDEFSRSSKELDVLRSQSNSIMELLRLPLQIDASLKNSQHDTSLNLINSCLETHKDLRASLKNINWFIDALFRRLRQQQIVFQNNLLDEISGGVELSLSLKTFELIRRLSGISEEELRVAYLERRNDCILLKWQIVWSLFTASDFVKSTRFAAEIMRNDVHLTVSSYWTHFGVSDDVLFAFVASQVKMFEYFMHWLMLKNSLKLFPFETRRLCSVYDEFTEKLLFKGRSAGHENVCSFPSYRVSVEEMHLKDSRVSQSKESSMNPSLVPSLQRFYFKMPFFIEEAEKSIQNDISENSNRRGLYSLREDENISGRRGREKGAKQFSSPFPYANTVVCYPDSIPATVMSPGELSEYLFQVLYASSTLKQFGISFSEIVLSLFEAYIERYISAQLKCAIKKYQSECAEYDWIPAEGRSYAESATNDGSKTGSNSWVENFLKETNSSKRHQGFLYHYQKWWSPHIKEMSDESFFGELHRQALIIGRHKPLAVLMQKTIDMFNELRQFALRSSEARIARTIQRFLLDAVDVTISIAATKNGKKEDAAIMALEGAKKRKNSSEKPGGSLDSEAKPDMNVLPNKNQNVLSIRSNATEYALMVTAFIVVYIPLTVECFRRIYKQSKALDEEKIIGYIDACDVLASLEIFL